MPACTASAAAAAVPDLLVPRSGTDTPARAGVLEDIRTSKCEESDSDKGDSWHARLWANKELSKVMDANTNAVSPSLAKVRGDGVLARCDSPGTEMVSPRRHCPHNRTDTPTRAEFCRNKGGPGRAYPKTNATKPSWEKLRAETGKPAATVSQAETERPARDSPHAETKAPGWVIARSSSKTPSREAQNTKAAGLMRLKLLEDSRDPGAILPNVSTDDPEHAGECKETAEPEYSSLTGGKVSSTLAAPEAEAAMPGRDEDCKRSSGPSFANWKAEGANPKRALDRSSSNGSSFKKSNTGSAGPHHAMPSANAARPGYDRLLDSGDSPR